MKQLGYLYLETPREEVVSQALYWNLLEGMYQGCHREARKLSSKYSFSKKQIKILGLDPLYTWIMEEENPSASHVSAFTQDIFDEIRHFRLRQIVSVLLRLGETRMEITDEDIHFSTAYTSAENLAVSLVGILLKDGPFAEDRSRLIGSFIYHHKDPLLTFRGNKLLIQAY